MGFLKWKDDTTLWYKDRLLHRDDDLPAIMWANGDRFWYQNGKIFRCGNLPAIERNNGDKEWRLNGRLHQVNDRPAIERLNGNNEWFVNGLNITPFILKYIGIRKLRAQKKIYFWIVRILYRPGSESSKRLSESSWKSLQK